jgi:hypothetical protein
VQHLVAEQVEAVGLVGHDGADPVVELLEQARGQARHRRVAVVDRVDGPGAHGGSSCRGAADAQPRDVGRDVAEDLGA